MGSGNRATRLLLTLWVSLASVSAYAQAYRWVDDNGKVHFGDRPPAGVSVQSLDLPEPQTPVVPPASVQEQRDRQRRLVEALEEERLAKEQKKQEEKAAREKQEAYCRRLLAQVKDSERISRFYKYDERGERVFMSDEKADRFRAELRSTYQSRCQSR